MPERAEDSRLDWHGACREAASETFVTFLLYPTYARARVRAIRPIRTDRFEGFGMRISKGLRSGVIEVGPGGGGAHSEADAPEGLPAAHRVALAGEVASLEVLAEAAHGAGVFAGGGAPVAP